MTCAMNSCVENGVEWHLEAGCTNRFLEFRQHEGGSLAPGRGTGEGGQGVCVEPTTPVSVERKELESVGPGNGNKLKETRH